MDINITIDKRSASMIGVLALMVGLPLTVAACDSQHNSGNVQDANDTAHQQDIYNNGGQRAHDYNHSQQRSTLQTVEDIEANGVATSSFAVNKTGSLLHFCPSLGMPVPSTDQLTNPQAINWGTNASGVVPQMEKTGVYTGDSTGTFVLCVRPNGTTYIDYWEGDVNATSAPAHWDQGSSQIVVDGDSPVQATITPKG